MDAWFLLAFSDILGWGLGEILEESSLENKAEGLWPSGVSRTTTGSQNIYSKEFVFTFNYYFPLWRWQHHNPTKGDRSILKLILQIVYVW
ncbi:hypothetical protein H5410_017511 [Solanum commersonii]|uniref:Uncharacterized protein n=1 Tax=Solanum commersonii TaxID=4109 RepID=A0A9J6A0P2_SOLCO|nr:hypothetical protein H5410_017511 [Solanum commersonii]